MTDAIVRRLQAADWTMLRDVRLAALASAPEAFGSTLARELAFGEPDWRRRIDSPSFVAWRDDEPVGLAGAVNRSEVDRQSSPGDWELVSMWVSPDARGSGVADLLAAAVVDAVKAAQAERLTLWVADGNARARAFYLRVGFQPTGARQVFRRHDGTSFAEEELAYDLLPDSN